MSLERSCLVYDENITGNLKNHWTKHRHICTNNDAFSMLVPNMEMKYNISDFVYLFEKKEKLSVPATPTTT